MPRKQNTQSENFDKPFPKALRELMETNGTTQSELAAYLQKTRQVISCYCDGSTSPTWETISGIATYYHVSADWLLGLSDVRSTDTQLRDICEYTGLSERTVSVLHSESRNPNKPLEDVNRLFGSFESIHGLICEISTAMKALRKREQQKGNITRPLPPEVAAAVSRWENERGGVVLDCRQAAEWHADHAGDMLRDLITKAANQSVSPSFAEQLVVYDADLPDDPDAQEYDSGEEGE